jgi:hypothetical protein
MQPQPYLLSHFGKICYENWSMLVLPCTLKYSKEDALMLISIVSARTSLHGNSCLALAFLALHGTPKLTYDFHSLSMSEFMEPHINPSLDQICVIILFSVRVANELGRGNPKAAKFSVEIILSTSIIIGVLIWVLCLIFGKEISRFLTSDEEVAETVSSLAVLLAFSILLNSVQPVLTGKFFFLILFYDKLKWSVKSKLN